MYRKPRLNRVEAELDITSFMNLMIVLVPVLLMMMVFSHITVLELKLPGLSDDIEQTVSDDMTKQLEVVVRKDSIRVNYPQGHLLKHIATTSDGYDYDTLVNTLKTVKSLFTKQGIDKKDLSLLLEAEVDYQTIITLMDKSRSYQAVVVASVVDAELFPNISLGDAPAINANAALADNSSPLLAGESE
ncbi:biopolymer transporter ExbD [Thalassotalea sp. 42_200_T64]|nr:biopolymer transporter ExbD [Thalassotalea sp. 42_200_T64]